MSIKNAYNQAKAWGDIKVMQQIESEKGQSVHEVEIENHLKEMSLRFERSPSQSTLKAWASDLAVLGYRHQLIRQVCQSIPMKMDKHPTLTDIMALIKPNLPQVEFRLDELTEVSKAVYPHLKAKFLTLFTQEQMDQMVRIYIKHIIPDCEHFNIEHKELMVLGDWCRCSFGSGEAILKQGLISNQKHIEKDKDYFLNPLKRYGKANNLIM